MAVTLEEADAALLEKLVHPLVALHEQHRKQPQWQPYLLEVGGELEDITPTVDLMSELASPSGNPAPLVDRLFYDLADDHPLRWQARWALAMAGWVPAQRDVAAAYAHAAVELRSVVREIRDRTPETVTGRALDRADLRVELAGTLSLGWGAVAGGSRSKGPYDDASLHTHAHDLGQDLLASFWRIPQLPARRVNLPVLQSPLEAREEQDLLNIFDDEESDPGPPIDEPPTLTVIPAFTNHEDMQRLGIDVPVVAGRSLPYALAPSAEMLRLHREGLVELYPHAEQVIDALLGDLVPDRPIRFRPTLIVGSPGSGKSSLIRLALDYLFLPFGSLDAATTMDQALVGSPRRWSQSYPSLPVDLVVRYSIANPALVIDEIEKAGRSSAGAITDALLSLLEPHTAKAWRDQCFNAECDLSAMNWLFSGNSIDGIPRPLVDRLRVLRMPPPEIVHVPALARGALRGLLAERGISSRLEPDLDPVELAAVTDAFAARPARSLRDLRRLVEGVIDARAAAPKH